VLSPEFVRKPRIFLQSSPKSFFRPFQSNFRVSKPVHQEGDYSASEAVGQSLSALSCSTQKKLRAWDSSLDQESSSLHAVLEHTLRHEHSMNLPDEDQLLELYVEGTSVLKNEIEAARRIEGTIVLVDVALRDNVTAEDEKDELFAAHYDSKAFL